MPTHTRIRMFNTKETYPNQALNNDLCQAVRAGNTVYVRGQVGTDFAGNLTGPLTVTSGNRLTHAGDTRYEYDGYGNRILEVTGSEEHHYTWDTQHRLTGYRWPAETDTAMELADEARTWIARCDQLAEHTDDDGNAKACHRDPVGAPGVGGNHTAKLDQLRADGPGAGEDELRDIEGRADDLPQHDDGAQQDPGGPAFCGFFVHGACVSMGGYCGMGAPALPAPWRRAPMWPRSSCTMAVNSGV